MFCCSPSAVAPEDGIYRATKMGPWKFRMERETGEDDEHPPVLYGTQHQMPAVTVDNVILSNKDDEWYALRVKRGAKTKPKAFAGMWAIPGGFLDYGVETLDEAIKRETQEETGIPNVRPVQAFTMSDPGRDPRQHTIAVVYITVLDKRYIDFIDAHIPQDREEIAGLKWINVEDDNYDFPFDHQDILKRAMGEIEQNPERYPTHKHNEFVTLGKPRRASV